MSDPDAHRAFQFDELNQINSALGTLRRLGIPELDPTFGALNKARAQALGKLGLVQPRTSTILRVLLALSPGEIRLFQDAELGWLVEAIPEPGAPPIRRHVSDEVAVILLKGELTHELEAELMAPTETPDN